MLILAIDPGMAGAAGLMDRSTGEVLDGRDLTGIAVLDAQTIKELLDQRGEREIVAVIEKSQAMPGQGCVSMFNYGITNGILFGILAVHSVRTHLVSASKWKSDMGLRREKEERQVDWKRRSLDTARRLFPKTDLRLQKHHNRAEALLLAEWARRFLFADPKEKK